MLILISRSINLHQHASPDLCSKLIHITLMIFSPIFQKDFIQRYMCFFPLVGKLYNSGFVALGLLERKFPAKMYVFEMSINLG